jgi:predicted aminopeptidase
MFWTAPLIMGLLSAAGSAVGGIAGAVSAEEQARIQAGEAHKQRALEERLAKEKIDEERRQQNVTLMKNATDSLGSIYGKQADSQNETAADKLGSADAVRSTLAKAFLGGGKGI